MSAWAKIHELLLFATIALWITGATVGLEFQRHQSFRFRCSWYEITASIDVGYPVTYYADRCPEEIPPTASAILDPNQPSLEAIVPTLRASWASPAELSIMLPFPFYCGFCLCMVAIGSTPRRQSCSKLRRFVTIGASVGLALAAATLHSIFLAIPWRDFELPAYAPALLAYATALFVLLTPLTLGVLSALGGTHRLDRALMWVGGAMFVLICASSTIDESMGLGAAMAGIGIGGIACRFLDRRRPGSCLRCGYDLRMNTSGVCPECGQAIDVEESLTPNQGPCEAKKRIAGLAEASREPKER